MGGDGAISLTTAGKEAFRRALAEAGTVVGRYIRDLPEREKRTLDHLMVSLASDIKALVVVDGEIDMTLVFAEVCLYSKQFFVRTVRRAGFTSDEYRILNELAGSGALMRQRDLRERLLMSRAAVCLACGSLAESGCITTEPSRGDRRGKCHRITRKGLMRFNEARVYYQSSYRMNIKDLTPDEERFFIEVNSRGFAIRARGRR